MKTSRIAFSFVLFLSSTSLAFAQTVTGALNQNSVVIGQCEHHEKDPGCVVPNLFGKTGLTLLPPPNAPVHFAHFIGQAQQTLTTTINTAIATQLAILPLISPSSGFTYRYDRETGAFVRTSSSFGPVYSERAETIGRGRFTVGAASQRFRFGALDGIDLHKVPAVFTHLEKTGTFMQNIVQPYESDVISTKNDINVHIDQTVLYGTVGITNRLDVSVAMPISSVRNSATSTAEIRRVSGSPMITLINPNVPGGTVPVPNPHAFANGTLQNTFPTSSGSASGIGDVLFRVKAAVLNGEKVRVAAAMDFRTATGDAQKLLGAGAPGFTPFVVVSGGKRFSPHANIGYQWNGDSILAGNITGTTFSEDTDGKITGIAGTPLITTGGPATKKSLPNQLLYFFGVDMGVTDRLTVNLDYLGQTVFDAPRIVSATFTTTPVAPALLPAGSQFDDPKTLATIGPEKKTTTLNNGSVGLKYNLFGGLLLTGNVLFRMDNHGLRQNVTPLVGLSYTLSR
jgi:hypothetical protein